MEITITRETTPLIRQRWTFYATMDARITLRLHVWEQQNRETKRHKWTKCGEGYRNRSHDSFQHNRGYRLPAASTPLPEDVVAEATSQLLLGVKIIGPVDPPPERTSHP